VEEREKEENVAEDKSCHHQPHERPKKKENGTTLKMT
jgi:hypothetical protein